MNSVPFKRHSEKAQETTGCQLSFPWPKRFVFGIKPAPTQFPISFKWGPELPKTQFVRTEIHPESIR